MSKSPLFENDTPPPKAEKLPHILRKHDDIRTDEFFWLKEREKPEVRSYLEAENNYTSAILQPTEFLQEKIISELKSRIAPEDASVPQKDDHYFYYHKFESEKEYPLLCRKKGALENPEEVILDGNILAKDHSYFSLGEVSHSPNHRFLAYSVDTRGRRVHTLFIKDLNTGEILDEISEVTGNGVWANDNKTLFYTRQDPETLRSYQVFKHILFQSHPKEIDTLIFQENDPTFRVSLFKSSSKEYLFADLESTITSETWYLNADLPTGSFQVFEPRTRGHEYSVDHGGDRFFVRTNHSQAKNFKLLASVSPSMTHCEEVIPHQEETLLEGFQTFKTHIALQERHAGSSQIRIYNRDTKNCRKLTFSDEAFVAQITGNREYDTEYLRIRYESPTQPESIYDYHVSDVSHVSKDERILRKQKKIPGYVPELYESKKLYATASDKTLIPISVVKKKETQFSSKTPCLIYGYGSYGISTEPSFSSSWISLLDRGFICVIAHIRGGSEMGRHWYEQGRQMQKKNTFTDFISCTEFLIQEQMTSAAHLYALGGSAGGLLMGSVINLRPDLYHGVVANVPFVDVLTTMLDESIPLTTGEYDEWGDPNTLEFYRYIRSYSPYDNLKDQDYPHLLVTTGIHDSQVQYWEPAKWVARLRTFSQAKHLILLWTDLESGHGGKAGRYNRLNEVARIYTFMLALEGIDH